MARITITPTRRSRDALSPDAVFFRAEVTDAGVPEADPRQAYDPSFHDLLYVWDFGDPGAVSDKVVNLPAVHNDLNRAYGKEVAHVFSRPGPHRVRCQLYSADGVFLAEDSHEIFVGDPERFFVGARTILVDPAGRGDPTRYRDAQVVATLEAAIARLAALGAEGRILLKRGQRYPISARITLGGGLANFRLGAWGTGARPVLEAVQGGQYDNILMFVGHRFANDCVLEGIGFQGLWDSTTESGQQITLFAGMQTNDKYYLLSDCTFTGSGTAATLTDVEPQTRSAFTLHNCDITNWGDYGVYVGRYSLHQQIALVGSAIHQHPRALMGGGNTKDGRRNQHGPVRLVNGGQTYIACCDLFSRNGWSGGAIGADQPCLRWNSNTAQTRSRGVVERVAMEGGFVIVAISDATRQDRRYGTNFVMDKCLLVGTARSRKGVDLEYTGTTIRNCLYVQPDRPLVTEVWRAVFSGRHDARASYADPGWPVALYSNTIVNRMSAASSAGEALRVSEFIDDFEVFSDENNVLYTPNAPQQMREDPGLAEHVLATVGGVWQTRYLGPSYVNRGAGAQIRPDRRFATPEGTVFAHPPRPGSAVIDTAMGHTAVDDFVGRLRTDPPDRGAFEA